MSDEGKDKKTSKRTLRINYLRCVVCGARKKEQDMIIQTFVCYDCYEKQNKRRNGFWQNDHTREMTKR